MAVVRSSLITLTIQLADLFAFGDYGNFTIIEGGMETRGRGFTEGNPPVTDTELNAIAVEFYTDATGNTARAATDTVGTTGMTRTLAQIASVTYMSPDEIQIIIDAGNGLNIDANENVYFRLSIVQPDV